MEWDKGPVADEELQIAKDRAEKKRRRIQQAEERKKLKKLARGEELQQSVSGETEKPDTLSDVICSAGRREELLHRAEYHLRTCTAKSSQKVRTVPGVNSFKGI